MSGADQKITAFYIVEKADYGIAEYLRVRGWQVSYADADFFRTLVTTSLLEDQLPNVVLLDGNFRDQGTARGVLETLQTILEGWYGKRIKLAQALMGVELPRELILDSGKIQALESEIRAVSGGVEGGAVSDRSRR